MVASNDFLLYSYRILKVSIDPLPHPIQRMHIHGALISILIILTITTQASARLAAELGVTRILTSGGAATALQVEKDSSSFPLDHHQTLKNIFD